MAAALIVALLQSLRPPSISIEVSYLPTNLVAEWVHYPRRPGFDFLVHSLRKPAVMSKSKSEDEPDPGQVVIFPGEKPGKRELRKWLDYDLSRILGGDGSALYRGLDPPSFAELRDPPVADQ